MDYFKTLILTIFLVLPAQLHSEFPSPKRPVQHPSIVVVEGRCTGFIAKDGVIITAAHCVDEDQTYAEVLFVTEQQQRFRIAWRGVPSGAKDIAILVGNTFDFVPFQLQTEDPEPLEELLYQIGYSFILPSQYMARGMLAGLECFKGSCQLLVAMSVFPGDSGSPLFNQSGEVIGVIRGSLYHMNVPLTIAADIDLAARKIDELNL